MSLRHTARLDPAEALALFEARLVDLVNPERVAPRDPRATAREIAEALFGPAAVRRIGARERFDRLRAEGWPSGRARSLRRMAALVGVDRTTLRQMLELNGGSAPFPIRGVGRPMRK